MVVAWNTEAHLDSDHGSGRELGKRGSYWEIGFFERGQVEVVLDGDMHVSSEGQGAVLVIQHGTKVLCCGNCHVGRFSRLLQVLHSCGEYCRLDACYLPVGQGRQKNSQTAV